MIFEYQLYNITAKIFHSKVRKILYSRKISTIRDHMPMHINLLYNTIYKCIACIQNVCYQHTHKFESCIDVSLTCSSELLQNITLISKIKKVFSTQKKIIKSNKSVKQ